MNGPKDKEGFDLKVGDRVRGLLYNGQGEYPETDAEVVMIDDDILTVSYKTVRFEKVSSEDVRKIQ